MTDDERTNKLDLASIHLLRRKQLPRTTSLPYQCTPFERSHSAEGADSSHTTTSPPNQPCSSRLSRYREDFIEIDQLGTGGFGTVHKAQNKLDGTVYAMKKIRFKSKNSSSLEKVLREVKALAKLDHQHVQSDAVLTLLGREFSNNKSQLPSVAKKFSSDDGTAHFRDDFEWSDEELDAMEKDKDEIEAEFNSPPGYQIWNFHMRDPFSKIGATNIVGSPTEETDLDIEWMRDREEEFSDEDTFTFEDLQTSPSIETDKSTWKKIHKSIQPQRNIILYIQMQLCEDTLQGWLESCTNVDTTTVLSIFRQICKGLKYIHSEGIIHRDLKPSNIFLLIRDLSRDSGTRSFSSPQVAENKCVVIGDFGLAVSINQDASSLASSAEIPLSTSSEHTSGVGTLVYSSPEQINGQSYDEKTDIYSLGIILFEMLHPMQTKMERAHMLSNIRKHILPPEFLNKFPKESAFILWLLAPTPQDRPSAAQILKHEIFKSESVCVGRIAYERLQEHIKQQQQLLELQHHQIEELQRKLAELQK